MEKPPAAVAELVGRIEASSALDEVSRSWFAALRANPYFVAGFGLSVLGTGLALARGVGGGAVKLAKRHFLVTLEVTSKDRSYPWVLSWLTAKAARQGGVAGSPAGGGWFSGVASTLAQHVSVSTHIAGNDLSGGPDQIRFDFAPCPGRHVVVYQGYPIMVERSRSEQAMLDINTGLPFETVTLTSLGRSREVFESLLRESSADAVARERNHTIVYKSWGTEWHPFGKPRVRRPMSSVILDDGVAEHIRDDVQQFAQSRQWYVDRGIPYRRGYLLHGPPGSGKTSFITALAGELGYDICVLNLAEAGLTDDRLTHALSNLPPNAIALLEDVDAAFQQRASNDTSQSRSYVTFSGLLNALDGVSAGEERVVFMTTNHLHRLDPALVRPGRADVLQLIDDASSSQQRRMFLKFYPDEHDSAGHFATAMTGCTVSMALLQGFFMTHRDDGPVGALAATHLLRDEAVRLAELQAKIAERIEMQHQAQQQRP